MLKICLYLCYKHNMLAAELLLKFSHQSVLDFLETPKLWHWNEDDNRLLVGSKINFLKYQTWTHKNIKS